MTLLDQVNSGVSALQLNLPEGAPERLVAYVALIEKWNRVHNLTAVREPEQMVILHVLDSLAIVPFVSSAMRLLDVGTGAGLPGIPLAIACPHLDVTLLDSNHKKTAFLIQAKAELGLSNCTIVCERVESWRPSDQFEVVVSRAFAELSDFVQQAAHLVAADGSLLAMKGVHPFDELAKVPRTHRVANVVELKVPALEASRHLVSLKAA